MKMDDFAAIGSRVRSIRLFERMNKHAGPDSRQLGALGTIISKRDVPSKYSVSPDTIFTVRTEDGRTDEYSWGELLFGFSLSAEPGYFFANAWHMVEDKRKQLLRFFHSEDSGLWKVMICTNECHYMDSLYAAKPTILDIEWEEGRRRVLLTGVQWPRPPWHNDSSFCSGRTDIVFASQEEIADTPIYADANLR